MIVADASVALKWVVTEDDSAAARSLLFQTVLAPELLFIECGNALWRIVQRGDITAAIAQVRLEALQELRIGVIETSALMPRALEIACDLGHPIYDCVYLAAAERFGATLVTADQRFMRRISASGRPYGHVRMITDAAAN